MRLSFDLLNFTYTHCKGGHGHLLILLWRTWC